MSVEAKKVVDAMLADPKPDKSRDFFDKHCATKEHADRAYAKFQTMPRSKSNLVLAINLTR